MAMIEERTPIGLYTHGEEVLNAVSHGVGTLFAVAGAAYLITWCALFSDAWAVIASAIYGGTLIILYAMSTLYHAITNQRAKRVMRVLDHSSIFLLIAGTYTPIAFVLLEHSAMGWTIFGLVWGSAVVGIILNAISIERFKRLSMLLYLLAGWAIVIAMKPVVERMPSDGLLLLFLGGVFYTGGIIFYVMKKKRYFHGIWHFFVLAGSMAHYFAILLCLMQ